MCARATNIGHAATNTHPRSNARDVDFDRFGLYCIAPHILFCELSRFCAFLTTSENSLTPRQTREIPGCPHLIRHIFLVVKVGKLILLLLHSSHCIFHYARANGSKVKDLSSVTFASRPATNLLHMEGSCSCFDFLDILHV